MNKLLSFLKRSTPFSEISPLPAGPKPELGPKPVSRPAILLVEDDPAQRESVENVLRDTFELLYARNGQEAMELLGSRYGRTKATDTSGATIDLIISELTMPVMDGMRLLEQLKAYRQYCHIPVLILTGRADTRTQLRSLRIGVDDYLLKPFDASELLARVEGLLKSRLEQSETNRMTSDKNNDEADASKNRPVEFSAEDRQWLSDLEQAVLSNIHNYSLSADFLAQKLALSRRQFFRRVNAITGKTPNDYINEARFTRARQLLEARIYKTVKEVSHAVGMKDTAYFSRQFSRRFGKQPSSYLS